MQTRGMITFFLLAATVSCAPFYVLPDHMIETPMVRKYTGKFNETVSISGVISITPVIHYYRIIGHRIWQNITGLGPDVLTVYGRTIVANETYPQAIIGPEGECLNQFNEYVTCTGWKVSSQTPTSKVYTNSCNIFRIGTEIKGSMKLSVISSEDDVPSAMLTTTEIAGVTIKYDLYLGDEVKSAVPRTQCPF
jgi:hypothetical protein